MSHINNKQMISKAISLKKNKIFQNSHYIHYSGTKVENFAAVVFAAFSLGHTVVLGKEKVTNDTIFDVHDEIISRAETKIEVLDLVRQIKRRQESDSIALITNTSGSTGTPKSIAFSYKSIINRVNEIITLYSLTNKTRELILLPITSTAIFFDQFLSV